MLVSGRKNGASVIDSIQSKSISTMLLSPVMMNKFLNSSRSSTELIAAFRRFSQLAKTVLVP